MRCGPGVMTPPPGTAVLLGTSSTPKEEGTMDPDTEGGLVCSADPQPGEVEATEPMKATVRMCQGEERPWPTGARHFLMDMSSLLKQTWHQAHDMEKNKA